MPAPVIALALDAMSAPLLESWVAAGLLPTFARLFREGTYARLASNELNRVENAWLALLQGCTAQCGQEWGHQDYQPGEYGFKERPGYDFRRFPPFYEVAGGVRLALLDIPFARLVPGDRGVQALGWGVESNQSQRQSSPPGLMAELIARHGDHPVYGMRVQTQDGVVTTSYRMPCVYDVPGLERIRDQLIGAAGQRTEVIKDLMRRGEWDLLLGTFAEVHTAGHVFWHTSQPHVLAPPGAKRDFLLEVVQAADRSLGDILREAPPDAQVVIFSPHGMQQNAFDLNTMLFLPELLYRWSTGNAALAEGTPGAAIPAMDFSRHWREEVWDLRTAHGEQVLESPAKQEARRDPLDWDPANWYREQWPRMRAFVLPGYSEGMIRINVAGRDGPGGIAPESYASVCDELCEMLMQVTDARTHAPIVANVVRMRAHPDDVPANGAPADLIVEWRDNAVGNVVEHPRHGRIGPVPYFRTGGHTAEGFFLACGAGFAKGERLEPLTLPDVTATLMTQLGAELPAHYEGRAIGGPGMKSPAPA